MKNCVIAGAGFCGAVIARKLAEKNIKVLLLEKRPTIGGNMYDYYDDSGVLVQKYGPHIFHTSSVKAFEAIKQYSEWFPYEHRVKGKINGKLVPVPFNFESLEALYPKSEAEKIKRKLSAAFPGKNKISVLELLEYDDKDINSFGNFVFDNVFKNYTAKQWGTPAENVDKSTINRVPVVLGYDDRYFDSTIQCMPSGGFTKIFEKMLNHPNITVELNCDASKRIRQDGKGKILFDGCPFEGIVVYTGAVDELLGYKYGPLPYRSVDMQFETLKMDYFQPASVVNYPNEEKFTRITEFKRLTNQKLAGATTILKEYPLPYSRNASRGNIPFYTIPGKENIALHRKYSEELEKYGNFYLCGRLAEYRYYNMDSAIGRALEVASDILKKL